LEGFESHDGVLKNMFGGTIVTIDLESDNEDSLALVDLGWELFSGNFGEIL